MFGYVKPVHAELLVKEYEFYKATYCGVCRAMKKHTGALSNCALSYDSVFLALVRMLYVKDGDIGAEKQRCIAHPVKRRSMLRENEALVYTAKAFAILTYHKLLDDQKDEGVSKKTLAAIMKPIFKKGKKRADISSLADFIEKKLSEICEIEDSGGDSVDEPAMIFGELLGEVFSFGFSGNDRLILHTLGYYLGKFIYAADAAEDYAEDARTGKYNPYVKLYGGAELTPENKASIRCALVMDCQKMESAVNMLPFGERRIIEDIIKNIIYLGLIKRIDFLDGLQGEQNKE